MINQLLKQKEKDPNYVRSIVLLILDATNDMYFSKHYNKSVIKQFRKRLYDNYHFVLKHFWENVKKWDDDVLINDILNYCLKLVLTNNDVLYDIYLKKYDDYDYDYDNDNYFFNKDIDLLKLKKQFFRHIYLIAYYFFKVLPNKKNKDN